MTTYIRYLLLTAIIHSEPSHSQVETAFAFISPRQTDHVISNLLKSSIRQLKSILVFFKDGNRCQVIRKLFLCNLDRISPFIYTYV